MAHFIDEVKIFVKAGNGGNGSCSFSKEKYLPKGGPDGGNGGDGGDVIIKAKQGINNLRYFIYKKKAFCG